MSLWWIFAFLIIERGAEIALSRRNERVLKSRGGEEHFRNTYWELVALHALFLICLAIESRPWAVPVDAATIVLLIVFGLLQAGRYWCMASLGVFWNTRIIVVPGGPVVRRGPYRFLRHPNYLIVTLEFAVIPMLMRAPVTLAVFFLANLLLLRRRIRLEETALTRLTDYRRTFG